MNKIIAVTLLAISPLSLADEQPNKMYVGASAGISKLAYANERSTPWGVFAGYQFNQYVAVEVGYDSLWRGSDRFDEDVKIDVDLEAWRGSVILSAPITDNFSPYFRGGYEKLSVNAETNGGDYPESIDVDGDYFFAGLGLNYDFDNTFIRGEVATMGDLKSLTYTLGAGIRF